MSGEVIRKESKRLREYYYEKTLDSGLIVCVFPKKLSTSYAIIGTRYGSIDNAFKTEGEAEFTAYPEGIAHFLEHKLFENEDGVDAFERYARFGANANAFTTFDKTAYLFSAADSFYESLEVLLDFVSHPFFNAEKVNKEQGIISQEIRMGEDNPHRRLFSELMKIMYQSHPIRMDIAGTVESISRITPEVLYACYNAFYRPSNMVLSVCGDLDETRVFEMAERFFPPREEKKVITAPIEEPRAVLKQKTECRMDVAKPLFNIGVKNPDVEDDPLERMRTCAGMSILSDMLFSKSGHFYNSLYEKGLLSNSFDYGYAARRSFAFFDMSGESRDPDAVYEAFAACIEEAKTNGLSREDFEINKRVTYASTIRQFESTEDIAVEMMEAAMDGDGLFAYSDIVQSVSFEDVERLLHERFLKGYFCMSVILPQQTDGEGESA